MSDVLTVESDNLSVAWARVFLHMMERGVSEASPVVVSINGFIEDDPVEDRRIRGGIDGALAQLFPGLSCHTVANTIFPTALWRPEDGSEKLYERYIRVSRRVRAYPRNRNGVYFERMIDFGNDGGPGSGFNQLQHIIDTWRRGNHRRSAMQVAIFDPRNDHTHQRQRGFPCLQQVAFSHEEGGHLSVTGFYATQYVVERTYGNFLGLSRLGKFMAHELGLELEQVNCVANVALLGQTSKDSLRRLAEATRAVLTEFDSAAA